eukprot:symbB.v1.2.007029.t3/scaffold428.1/size206322/4
MHPKGFGKILVARFNLPKGYRMVYHGLRRSTGSDHDLDPDEDRTLWFYPTPGGDVNGYLDPTTCSGSLLQFAANGGPGEVANLRQNDRAFGYRNGAYGGMEYEAKMWIPAGTQLVHHYGSSWWKDRPELTRCNVGTDRFPAPKRKDVTMLQVFWISGIRGPRGEGAEKSEKPEKIPSDGSNVVLLRHGSLKKGEVPVDETIVKDVADAKAAAEKATEKASAAAENALSSAQELQKEMASIWQALQNVRSTSPKDVWPHRNAPLSGRLPNLPPSSLAHEEADRRSQPYPIEKESELEKVQHLKERFFPPTGGCFRTGTSHRYRSRKRPATAQMQLQVLKGGGSNDAFPTSRPLTAGNERRRGTGDD